MYSVTSCIPPVLTRQSERVGAGRWLFAGKREGDLMHYQEFFACLAEARNAGFTPYLSDAGEVRLALPSKEGICDPINAVWGVPQDMVAHPRAAGLDACASCLFAISNPSTVSTRGFPASPLLASRPQRRLRSARRASNVPPER